MRQGEPLIVALTPQMAGNINHPEREENYGEGIQVEGFDDVTAEQRGEGAGSSAARTLKVKVNGDRAVGIEGVTIRREAKQEYSPSSDQSRGQRSWPYRRAAPVTESLNQSVPR